MILVLILDYFKKRECVCWTHLRREVVWDNERVPTDMVRSGGQGTGALGVRRERERLELSQVIVRLQALYLWT